MWGVSFLRWMVLNSPCFPTSLKLMVIFLPLGLQCWDYTPVLPCLTCNSLYSYNKVMGLAIYSVIVLGQHTGSAGKGCLLGRPGNWSSIPGTQVKSRRQQTSQCCLLISCYIQPVSGPCAHTKISILIHLSLPNKYKNKSC